MPTKFGVGYLPRFTFLVLAHPGSPGHSPGGCKTVAVAVIVVVVGLITANDFPRTRGPVGYVIFR